MSHALSQQRQLYLAGAQGKQSLIPFGEQALAQAAKRHMHPAAYDYVAGGAGHEESVSENRKAFQRWKIVPRMLRDVSQRSTETTILGHKLPAPLLLSPVGVLEDAHREADLAVAKAATQVGIPMIFSSQASVSMERCAAAMEGSPRWFQLYWSKSDELVLSLVQRAEAAGCSAIVVTLDTTMLGWRHRDLNQAYLPFLYGKGIAQYTSDPVFQRLAASRETNSSDPKPRLSAATISLLFSLLRRYPGNWWKNLRSGAPMKAVKTFTEIYTRPSLNWENLKFLREHTQLPIILKGVMHPEDARKSLDHGIDALIVSNHGGRQVAGTIASLEALVAIKAAVGTKLPLLMDGGIRSGADMLKALALGADAVCIGRPFVYALAIAGEAGVKALLDHLIADFELSMALSGFTSPQELNPDLLVRQA